MKNPVTDRKIDDQTKDIIQGSDEWTGSKCGIDFEFIQRHWNPCAEEARKNDHTEKRDARCEAQMIIDLEEQAHTKNNGRTNGSIQKTNAQFLR